MPRFSELLSEQHLLPIIQADEPDVAVNIARAVTNAGLMTVEIALRSENALAGLMEIKRQLPELTVGAGSVYNSSQLRGAINAGADFIVTPTVSDNLLSQLYLCKVPVLPGVSNPGQVLQAYEYGFKELKFFPAPLSGGTKMLTALTAIFKDVLFCPTGGINESNKNDYLKLDNVFGVGGTWMVDQDAVKTQNWDLITSACLQAASN